MYTFMVGNNGQGPTSGTVTVTDNVPSGLTPTSIGGGGWNCTQPAGPCTRSDVLAPGAIYPVFQLMASVTENAPSSITNTATVSGGGDPSSHNANDTAPVAQAQPSLTITKTHSGTFSAGQSGAAYDFIVGNSGQGPTSGPVTVTDNVRRPDSDHDRRRRSNCTQPAGPCTRSDVLGRRGPSIRPSS